MYVLCIVDDGQVVYVAVCENREAAENMLFSYVVKHRNKVVDLAQEEDWEKEVSDYFATNWGISYSIVKHVSFVHTVDNAKRMLELNRKEKAKPVYHSPLTHEDYQE